MILQGGNLCCRSASHSTGMVGIELVAVLGDLKVLIEGTVLPPQLVQADRVLCMVHCYWNRYAGSGARILPRDTAKEFVRKESNRVRARRGEGAGKSSVCELAVGDRSRLGRLWISGSEQRLSHRRCGSVQELKVRLF